MMDSEAQYIVYIYGQDTLSLRALPDGEVVTEVPLGHEVLNGSSVDDMMVTIGESPYSASIINDRHKPEQQQLVLLSDKPAAVAISPAKDTIAVMQNDGSRAFAPRDCSTSMIGRDDTAVGDGC
jgi:hypothetical protein